MACGNSPHSGNLTLPNNFDRETTTALHYITSTIPLSSLSALHLLFCTIHLSIPDPLRRPTQTFLCRVSNLLAHFRVSIDMPHHSEKILLYMCHLHIFHIYKHNVRNSARKMLKLWEFQMQRNHIKMAFLKIKTFLYFIRFVSTTLKVKPFYNLCIFCHLHSPIKHEESEWLVCVVSQLRGSWETGFTSVWRRKWR